MTTARDVAEAIANGSASTGGNVLDAYAEGKLSRVREAAGATSLSLADHGRIVFVSSGTAVDVTVPETLPAGFVCTVIATGAGVVSIAKAGGATLNGGASSLALSAAYSGAAIVVLSNQSGTAAACWVQGALA